MIKKGNTELINFKLGDKQITKVCWGGLFCGRIGNL